MPPANSSPTAPLSPQAQGTHTSSGTHPEEAELRKETTEVVGLGQFGVWLG